MPTIKELDASIIIVNYNTTKLTIKCIEAVKFHTRKNTYEIILVDNASPDKSILSIVNIFPDVKLIVSDTNLGFGRANNLGIEKATGKYIFLLNTDAFLLSDAIHSFWTFMEFEESVNIACCCGELVNTKNEPVESYGNFPSILEAFSSMGFGVFYWRYYKRHIHSGVVNYSSQIRAIDYACGADMFIRKKVFNEVGVFDPDFFLYYEETELSYRFFLSGYQSFILPEIKIVHLGGESQKVTTNINFNQIDIMSKSRYIFFSKIYGKSSAEIVNILYTLKTLIIGLLSLNVKYFKIAKIIYKSKESKTKY